MDLLHRKCAGLDVHPRSVSACARLVVDGQATHEVRTFGTSTRELRAMADWLASLGCTHVAMESTGVIEAFAPSMLKLLGHGHLLAHGLCDGTRCAAVSSGGPGGRAPMAL